MALPLRSQLRGAGPGRTGWWLLLVLWLGSVVSLPAAGLIEFEGNDSHAPRRLLEVLRRDKALLTGEFDVMEVDDAAYFLEKFYLRNGFAEARVDYRFTASPRRAVFVISEGERTRVQSLEVSSQGAVEQERLASIARYAFRAGPVLLDWGPPPFSEPALTQARREMVSAAEQDGFLQARVDGGAESADPGWVKVRLRVEEGPRFRVVQTVLRGMEAGVALDRTLAELDREPYRPGREEVYRLAVLQDLRNRGHYAAVVRAQVVVLPAPGEMRMEITAEPGPVYHLGDVRLQGVNGLLARSIALRLGWREGRLYNASEIEAGLRRLWFTGALSRAELSTHPRADGHLDLTLEVQRAAARQIGLSLGYGQWQQANVTLAYTDRNFLDTLNRLTIEGFLSQRSRSLQVRLADPFFLGTDHNVTLQGGYARIEQPSYQSTVYGGELNAERRFESGFSYAGALTWREVDDTTIFAVPDAGLPLDYRLVGAGATLAYDRRNNRVTPMSGTYLRATGQWAGRALGGDLDFTRWTGKATFYLPLRPLTPARSYVPYLMVNAQTGLIQPFGGTTDIPLQERFYLGGSDTVRSFPYEGMDPRNDDDTVLPVGGTFFTLLNAELNWPVWGPLYLAALADLGNLVTQPQYYRAGDGAAALGGGLRVYTPVGFLRMDYGYNPAPRESDPQGAWHFSFGLSF